MERRRSIKDILSGLIFIGFGLAFGIAAAGYDIGAALRMGPGYFPLVLAVVIGALGVAILVKGLVAAEDEGGIGPIPWRGLILLSIAVIFFGVTIRGLGLAPCLFVTVFLTAMASRRNTIVSAALIAAGLTLFCSLIFIYGLGVALPLVGPWLAP
jgi:Tripartite tricarboxylate transporter TctB family